MRGVESWDEIGERIAEARHAAGLSQGELGERVALDRTMIVRIEAGDRRITALELFRLADVLGVPAAHLISRPPAPLVSQRTALAEHGDELSHAGYRLDVRLEEHTRNAQWLVGHGFLRPSAPASAGRPRDPVALARWARDIAGQPSGPLGPLADVAERLGLFLTVVDEAAEGASLLHDGFGVSVVSSRLAPGRRRWTAAHELGHHLLEDEYHSDAGVAASRDEREQLIDRFAGAFLLPETDFRRHWELSKERDQAPRPALIEFAAAYRLSWSAVVACARDLGAVDRAEARRLAANTPVRGDFLAVVGSVPEPDLPAGTTGTAWRRAVLAAWSAGAITAPRAVQLLYGALDENELPSRDLEDVLP